MQTRILEDLASQVGGQAAIQRGNTAERRGPCVSNHTSNSPPAPMQFLPLGLCEAPHPNAPHYEKTAEAPPSTQPTNNSRAPRECPDAQANCGSRILPSGAGRSSGRSPFRTLAAG
jgi:hypothetical protein